MKKSILTTVIILICTLSILGIMSVLFGFSYKFTMKMIYSNVMIALMAIPIFISTICYKNEKYRTFSLVALTFNLITLATFLIMILFSDKINLSKYLPSNFLRITLLPSIGLSNICLLFSINSDNHLVKIAKNATVIFTSTLYILFLLNPDISPNTLPQIVLFLAILGHVVTPLLNVITIDDENENDHTGDFSNDYDIYDGKFNNAGYNNHFATPQKGYTQQSAKKYCPYCGTEIDKNAQFCPECGTKIN